MAKDPQGYWAANKRLIYICLAIWAFASFGMGIVFRPLLKGIQLNTDVDLGFWMAQQGAIYVFLILIFFYAARMNKIDREYGVDE